MSLEDLLRKLASSAEASPEILTIPREIQVFAHDDTSARAVLARLRSEWEAHARTSPRRALVLAMAVFRVSRDWQRRWPLGDFLPKLAESLRGVSHEAELEREVASLLRELPKAELAAVLEHASTPGPSCPEGTCLERLGGARVLARVGSFAHPTHEEHHAASDVDAVLAAVASLGSSSLDDLHAALGVFTGTLDEVARAAFLLGAVKVSVESGLPIAAHWLTKARGHETLSDALARPYDEGPLAAAFASVVSRLPSETRLAVLEKSAVAFMPTYGHFVGREEPSFVRATVEACAALGGDGKHTLGRAKTAAKVVTMLGPPVEAEVVRALPAATPEGLLAFTLALENEEVARSAVELLGHAHKDIRREAAEALRAYGPAADRALEEGTRAKKKAVRETCSALLDERRSARENPLDRALAVLDEAARTELETTVSRLSSEPAVLQSFGNPRLLANGAFDRFGPAAYLASAYRRWLSRPESRDAERPVTYGLERWMEVRESSPDELVNEIFVHVAVHLPALEDHQVERFVHPLVPFLRAHTGRLAEAIAHRGEVSGRIVLVEAVLAKNPADVSTVFWAEAMSDGSKRIRKIAAQSLAGRRGLAEALTPVLSAKKAEIRVAVADLIARERCEGVAEILRAARALETDAKAAAALDRALAAVPDGATEPSVGRASTVARGASKTERVSPSDVRAELAAMKKGKIPKFASSALLPTPTWADGADLSEHELAVLFSRLANEGSDLEDPELRRIRAALVPASAAAFGDALYDAWYEGGRDSKHKFAVFQLGLFGSERRLDEVAQRLGIEASHGQHHYATWCLEALARRGRALQDEATSPADGPAVDTGLSWVAHWARAATTESLGHGARELLARERELRGLDERAFAERVNPFVAADAADRSIVRVDLETRFTFGARSFSPAVVHGRLALRADNGTVLEALPKRSPKDEPAAHENEKQRFEALSGHVAHVLAWESSRLEGAMVSHRVWPVPAFLELAAHPLVRHLLEGLLARAGTLLFRASLTGPVDVDARPVPKERLLAAPGVTLPHRIDLDPPTLTAWREHLHRADVRPPFAQLDREVHEDLADLAVDRLRTLRAQALVARLLEARWQHGRPHENGLYDESFRLFSGYGVRAVFHHDGIGIASNDFQTGPIGLHSLRFEDVFGKALEPSEVPAVVRSEVARDLRAILR